MVTNLAKRPENQEYIRAETRKIKNNASISMAKDIGRFVSKGKLIIQTAIKKGAERKQANVRANITKAIVHAGRPKGAVSRKYAQYGGVQGYRQALRQQKALQRQRLLQLQQARDNPTQQYQTNQIQRQVVPVFKSSGGSPYPPVDNTPLENNRYAAYYETTDAFTGERIIKRRLPSESWVR